MSSSSQKLSFGEKFGYSLGDAAANFVFMTMVLFQSNFYTDVFGLSAATAGTIILVARLWDAFFDPLMGVMADRTNSRWGRFRPWVLFTAVPWAVVMFLAYRTPENWSASSMFAYALITNMLLMTLYSMNNMPYSALGGVMTGDLAERAKLNSYRFIAVNIAQFIVGGFTLPLVAKFAGPERNLQHGWAMTMGLWACVCLVCFLITFATSKERIQPEPTQKSSLKEDFGDLLRNSPWMAMFGLTLVHFALISLQGGAMYNYYNSYADKTALFNWLHSLGLTAPPLAPGEVAPGGVLEWLGYVVHADPSNLETSNVSAVANSIMNMIGKIVIIVVILASPSLAVKFGKKAVAIAGFSLSALVSFAFYTVEPTNVSGMIFFTILGAAVYAPTIPLIWAMFADVADYSEWKTGRRATGIIFATIGFALKAGLSLGSASFLWLMGSYGYSPNQPQTAETLQGIRMCGTVYLGVLFLLCTILLVVYKIGKSMTLEIANELATRRAKLAASKA